MTVSLPPRPTSVTPTRRWQREGLAAMSTTRPRQPPIRAMSTTPRMVDHAARPPLEGEHSTTTVRASSSPPSGTATIETSTRRPLPDQVRTPPIFVGQSARRKLTLEDSEVFDMAVKDSEVFDMADAQNMDRLSDVCIASPQICTPMKMGSPGTLDTAADVQPDVWSVEDWSSAPLSSRTSLGQQYSPVSSGVHTSPRGVQHRLDEPHRIVADAILAELQVDMESNIQKAVNQMSSWVSEEIVFARQGLVDDIHKAASQAAEAQMSQHSDVQRLRVDQLSSKVEQMQASLEDQLVIMKMQQTQAPQCPAGPTSPQKPRASDARVQEARMVAEERQRRMKLESIEDTLGKHLERIDSLGQQLAMYSTKSAQYDIDLREKSHGIQKLDAAMKSALETASLNIKTQVDTHLAMIEALHKKFSDAEALAKAFKAEGEKNIQDSKAELAAHSQMIDSLCKRSSHADTRLTACETSAEKNMQDNKAKMAATSQMIDSLCKRSSDLETQLSCCQASIETDRLENRTHVETHMELIKMLRKESSDVEALVAGCDVANTLQRIEAWNLAEQVTRHEASIENNSQVVNKLEEKWSAAEAQLELGEHASNLATNLIEEVGLQNTKIKSAIESLEQKLSAAETSQLAAQALAGTQIQQLGGALHAQIFAAEEMQAQILSSEEGLSKSLAIMSQDLQTQLHSKINSALATVDEVTRQLLEKSVLTDKEIQKQASELKPLAEHISTVVANLSRKASNTELETMRTEFQTWVQTTCDTTQKTSLYLADMFEQTRLASEGQNIILKEHDIWMKQMSRQF